MFYLKNNDYDKRRSEKAAENYAASMCSYCSANLFCNGKNKKCAEFYMRARDFTEGVKWADKHPKNVWHNASEEPQGEDWLILFEGEKGNYWVQSKDGVIFFHNTWKEYVKAEMVAKWAYIDELIKK